MPSKGSTKPRAAKRGKSRPKRPLCHTCGKRIHVPFGWQRQSAVRKHYWAQHPEVMRRGREGR